MRSIVGLVVAALVAVACSTTPTEPTSATEPSPVDESVAPAVDDRGSAHLFDPEALHTFDLVLDEDSLAELDADPTAEEYVEGAVVFNGEMIEPVGIRYKGSIGAFVGCLDGPNPLEPEGAKTCTKLSMKVKINWDDPDGEFLGVRKLQFHSQNLDPSHMHERLGYWLFREMGVPAPRSTHARVLVNGEYVGLFALTEQIDGRFTRENFDDGTGNLYKEVWPFGDDGRATSSDDWLDGLETNEDEDPTTELVETFAAELLAAEPGARRSVVERWMDVDSVIAHLVVDRAIRHDDGPFHWYCDGPSCSNHNYYFYADPSAEKLHLIPWDLDNAFENIRFDQNPVTPVADVWDGITADCEPFPYGGFGFPQRSAACDPLFAAWTEFEAEFDDTMAKLLDGPLSPDVVDPLLTSWRQQIEDSVAEAAETHDDAISVDEFSEALERLRADLTLIGQ